MSPRWTKRAALTAGALLTSITLGVGSAATLEQGADGAGDPYYPTDGNGGYDVADYNVAIKYDPSSQHLDATTTVTAKATEQLDRFNLDLHKLDVNSVKVNGEKAEFTREGEHELVVTPGVALAQDSDFTVEVAYGGTPEPIEDAVGKGGWQISQSGGAFAAGEPHSATTWYPANDHPSDKATFHLTASVPEGWSVISNGTEGGTETKDGWTTSRWNEDTPMATYLSTVAIDKWEFERGELPDGTPIVDAYAPGAEKMKEQEKRLPEILEFLSSKFGEYPQRAAGGIFLADPISFSLELQTRPLYTADVGIETIVHENAHEWFGDSVSIAQWRDIALNECFASYSQWMWNEAKNDENLDDTYRDEVASQGDEFWNRPLVDMGPGNEFTAVYDKGQLAVHALRRQVGEEDFDKILKTWTAEHRDRNASWEQFEELSKKISGQQLDAFFKAWFHDKAKPADKFLWPGDLHP